MNPSLRILLLMVVLGLSTGAANAAGDPATAQPAIDRISATYRQSSDGVDVALRTARYYAGWIPRGFLTAMFKNRPDLLPGRSMSRQDWEKSGYYRDGLRYINGLTLWGARHRAERFDQKQAIDEAGQAFVGTPVVALGRFLGLAADPMAILAAFSLIAWLRRLPARRRLRQQARASYFEPDFSPDLHYPERVGAGPSNANQRAPQPPRAAPDSTLNNGLAPASVPLTGPAIQPAAAGNGGGRASGRGAGVTEPFFAVPPVLPTTAVAADQPALRETPFTAYQVCRDAAEAGSAKHQFQLAGMFRHGRGVNPSREEATYWFRRAAESGHAQAQFELARRLIQGIGVLPDEHAAAMWLEQAAYRGLTDARFNLATLYASGRGVDRDPAAARRWLEESANDGDADAGDLLRHVFEHGCLDLDPDPERARYWQRRADADRG